MQLQRQNQLFLLTALSVVAVAVLSLVIIRTITTQQPISTVSRNVAAPQTVAATNVVEDLKFNHQVAGLAPNERVYQASLNFADFPSVAATNRAIAEYLKFNHQTFGLDPNWRDYQASLNWADYLREPSTASAIAEYLKFNHQTGGLAPNWRDYQASLNWAEYYEPRALPPMPPADRPDMHPF